MQQIIHDLLTVLTGFYADNYKKLEIDNWFLFTFYKNLKHSFEQYL